MTDAPMRWRTGGCHCGAVRFEVLAPDAVEARECNCSICRKAGYLHLIVEKERFRLVKGADKIATYSFNTGAAKHHFCSVCGIYMHHKRRSNPNELGINVACLDGVSPFDFPEVVVYDGQRHPADNAGQRTYTAGVLRFEPAAEG